MFPHPLQFRVRPTSYGYRSHSPRHSKKHRCHEPSTLNPAHWVRLWKAYKNARRLGYDPFTAWRAAKKST